MKEYYLLYLRKKSYILRIYKKQINFIQGGKSENKNRAAQCAV